MTNVMIIYDAFLSKILEDDWLNWSEEGMKKDLYTLLLGAITNFKFPRISLEIQEDNFVEDLDNEEVQILATYMKCEWLNRTILTWENVKPMYEERDFSQANYVNKIKELLDAERINAARLESKYYRSIKNKPFDYRRLAGNNG